MIERWIRNHENLRSNPNHGELLYIENFGKNL